MKKEIDGCHRRCVVFSVHSLEILKFLRLLCRWKKISPRAVAKPKRELHGLWRDADVSIER